MINVQRLKKRCKYHIKTAAKEARSRTDWYLKLQLKEKAIRGPKPRGLSSRYHSRGTEGVKFPVLWLSFVPFLLVGVGKCSQQ